MNTLNSHWTIDHLGIAVPDLEQAISFYIAMTNAQVGIRERLESQGVELAFINTGATKIELLTPLRPDSTLGRFLHTRGPGIHHVCYRVRDIRKELKRLSESGVTLIDREPREGAGGTLIAFLHPASCIGTLTELCEYSNS